MTEQQVVTKPLRVCSCCGLEAYTEEDLELFKKDKRYKYGRATVCKTCANKWTRRWQRANPEKVKARNDRHNPRQIGFQGTKILFKENPRTNVCSRCGKSYPEELKKQTAMHHEFYNRDDPLAGTIELCQSCHMKLHNKRWWGEK